MKYLKAFLASFLIAELPVILLTVQGAKHDYVNDTYGGVPFGTLWTICILLFIISFPLWLFAANKQEKQLKAKKQKEQEKELREKEQLEINKQILELLQKGQQRESDR